MLTISDRWRQIFHSIDPQSSQVRTAADWQSADLESEIAIALSMVFALSGLPRP